MSIDALRKFKPTSPDLIVRKRLYSDATLAPTAYVNELNDKLTEVITEVNALTIEGYKGVLDCSTNPNYPAGVKDWYWRVSVAGKIGGASGIEVEVGDMIICTITNNGGTQAAVGADFMIVEKNMFPCLVATLRTGTDNADFVTAKTLADAGLTFATTTILALSGGTTQQLLLTSTATQKALAIVGTAQTVDAITGSISVNSSNFNFISCAITPSVALSGAELITGTNFNLTSLLADADGSLYYGHKVNMISAAEATTYADMFGLYITNSGSVINGANTVNHKGIYIASTLTINTAGTANYYGIDVDLSGMTLTAASAVYGMNLTLMAGVTAGILVTGNTTTGEGINITSSALTTGHALQITASINSSSCQVINVDVVPSAALTGSEAVIGCDIAVQGNGSDANGTSWTCYNGKIEGVSSCQADFAAYTVDMVGTLNTADTHNGLVVNFGQTMNNAGATVYGTRIATGSFTHTSGNWYGHYINQTYTTTAGVSVGIGIDSVLSSATTKAVEITTSSATATATLINSMKLIQVMSGASTTNMIEAAQFIVQSAVQMGNWANAVLAKIDLTTTGYVTGLAGVVCAELDMPSTGPSGSTGTYTCFEAEINMAGATVVPVSAITINTWGAEVASFGTSGYIMDLNIPVAGSGLVFQTNTAPDATHALRIRINGTPYYMMLTTVGA